MDIPTLKPTEIVPSKRHQVREMKLLVESTPTMRVASTQPPESVDPLFSAHFTTIPSAWNATDPRFHGVTVRKFIGHDEIPFSLFDPCSTLILFVT